VASVAAVYDRRNFLFHKPARIERRYSVVPSRAPQTQQSAFGVQLKLMLIADR
jgi:hypothetical protein